jgi:arylsulfatase A-like enzyme
MTVTEGPALRSRARRTRSRRVRIVALAVAAMLVGASCGTPGREASWGAAPPDPGPAAIVTATCDALPPEQLERIVNGTHPERSGQIVFVPDEPNFVGTNFPHSGPWDYLQEVPLFWYGPGVIPARGVISEPVTLADVAPTQAGLLGMPFTAPHGVALPGIPPLTTPPPLIVTLVWDAAGKNVLATHPHAWPVLRSFVEDGAWFDDATVGSSPSVTPASHASIGTGAFPSRTGQTDIDLRMGSRVVRAGELGPQLLLEPTLGDLYDRAMGNEPLVAMLGTVNWHLNMASHGSFWEGGDRDLAVLRMDSGEEQEGREGQEWNLLGPSRPYYRFPRYVNDLPPLSSYVEQIDRADGRLDGMWLDNSIRQYERGWGTPARIPYQARMVEEVIAREGFGNDDVPDLLFVNFKAIDHVSHVWSTNSREMRDTVRVQDRELGRFVRFLDDEVGEGRWVLVLTADHGAQFHPSVSGAFQVTVRELARDLREAFPSSTDRSVFRAVRTSQVFVNEEAMVESGYTFTQIAGFLLDYTKAQGAVDPSEVPEAEREDRVFSAALPIDLIPELPCLVDPQP